MSVRRLHFIFAAVIISIILPVLNGCIPAPERNEYITIGALLPLTGNSSDDGLRAFNGLQLAKAEINERGGILGKQLDLIILDDRDDPEFVVQQYQTLIEKGVSAIIGSSYSMTTIALARAAEEHGIPVISPTASNPAVTRGRPNVFRTIFIDDYQASAMAYFARNSLDAQTALVVVSDIDGSFNHIAEVFATEFQALGGQTEMFPIAGSFARIFERYRDDPPDIVYFPANFDAAAEMINAAHAADLSDMHILGSDAWDGLLTYIVEPGAMRNVYYTSAFSFDDPDPAITQFVRRFLSYFSQMPLTASATAYTCVFILAEAIEKAGGTNADDIVSAMRTLEFDTIIGRIRFDENNNPRTSVYVIQIKDGVYSMYKKISAQETGGEWD